MPGDDRAKGLSITREDFDRIHRKIFATLIGQGASEEEAQDLSQEAFLRAHRGLKNFQERARLDTWVVGIAKKVWLQYRRDRGRIKRGPQEDQLGAEDVESQPSPWGAGSTTANPEEQTAARQELAQAKEEISRLPDEMQLALKLCVEGYPYGEIGQLLQIPVGRVSSLIHQARQKLRRRLPKRPADSAP